MFTLSGVLGVRFVDDNSLKSVVEVGQSHKFNDFCGNIFVCIII